MKVTKQNTLEKLATWYSNWNEVVVLCSKGLLGGWVVVERNNHIDLAIKSQRSVKITKAEFEEARLKLNITDTLKEPETKPTKKRGRPVGSKKVVKPTTPTTTKSKGIVKTTQRKEAISQGKEWYYPDKPCKKCGKEALRHVRQGSSCTGCYPEKLKRAERSLEGKGGQDHRKNIFIAYDKEESNMGRVLHESIFKLLTNQVFDSVEDSTKALVLKNALDQYSPVPEDPVILSQEEGNTPTIRETSTTDVIKYLDVAGKAVKGKKFVVNGLISMLSKLQ